MCRACFVVLFPENQEPLSPTRSLRDLRASGVVYPPKERASAVWRSPEHQPPTPTPTPSATAHLSGCDFTYTLEEAGVTLARGDNQVALARGGDLEEVGVDARGSDRRAGAGPLHGIRRYVRNMSYGK